MDYKKMDNKNEMNVPKSKSTKKNSLLNVAVVVTLIIIVLLCLYGWQLGIFRDLDTLRAYIDKAGFWAPLAFILLHLVQIIIPFIPGGVVQTAGVIIFGPWRGFFLNYIGIAIGSIVSFALARHYGQSFVRDKVGPEVWHKYFRWLDSSKIFPRLFGIAILLPFAPDDALCMLAGIANISWPKFLFYILLGKIPVLLIYSFTMLGANQLL